MWAFSWAFITAAEVLSERVPSDLAVCSRHAVKCNCPTIIGKGIGEGISIMRKRIITPTPETVRSRGEGWLDVERAALVEITSEEPDYPIEAAFKSGETRGWRAATAGSQTIRLIFDHPQRIKRISLVFEESDTPRTQEFVLRWSSNGGNSFQEIVRQQWNFSPPHTRQEVEEYQVDLSSVMVLELTIVPNAGAVAARASLKSLRLS